MMLRFLACSSVLAGVSLLAACSTQSTQSAAPTTTAVPANLAVAADEKLALVLPAEGVQIYECRIAQGSTDGKAAWAFVAPEADLFDIKGKKVGTHYAGPTWEYPDGSKIVGTVKARADAPVSGAIPWLLLDVKSTGTAGKLASITRLQRVNTVAGVAPSSGCGASEIGRRERVTYTADYYLFEKK